MLLDYKQIKLLGFTTDVNACDCCGKENLKGTVKIETDFGIVYYGTTCASKANKFDSLEASKAMKKDVRKAAQSYRDFEGNCVRSTIKALREDAKKYNVTHFVNENGEPLTKGRFLHSTVAAYSLLFTMALEKKLARWAVK